MGTTLSLRHGGRTQDAAADACLYFRANGVEGCVEESIGASAASVIKPVIDKLDHLNPAEEAFRKVVLGWKLIFSPYSSFEEGRLQFLHALAAFPNSRCLLTEFSAAN